MRKSGFSAVIATPTALTRHRSVVVLAVAALLCTGTAFARVSRSGGPEATRAALSAASPARDSQAQRARIQISGLPARAPAGSAAVLNAVVPIGARCRVALRAPDGRTFVSARAVVRTGLVQFPWHNAVKSGGRVWSVRVRCSGSSRQTGISRTVRFRLQSAHRSGLRAPRMSAPIVVNRDPGDGGKGAGGARPWGETLIAGAAWFGGHGVDVKSNGPDYGTYCVDPCGKAAIGRSGYAFQCVELVETFLLAQGWISTPIPARFAWEIYGGAPASKFAKHPGGDGYQPVPGDVLVWSKGWNNYGHVAVVEWVAGDRVGYVEQNASPTGRNYTTISSNSARLGNVFTGYLHANANAPVVPPVVVTTNLTRASAAGHVLRVAATGTAYLADGTGTPHWIPDSWTYYCVLARGAALIDSLAQSEVDALGNGRPAQSPCMRPSDAASHILRVAATGTTYLADANGVPHWIPDGGTYNCLLAKYSLIDGLAQSHVDSLGNGQPWATCSGPPPPPPTTWAESTVINSGVNTFANYHNASGVGPHIDKNVVVQVSCKVLDGTIPSVNPDGYWYRIASAPWNNAYYSPANTFLNGDPPGGPYSRNTDWAVPNC
jgi:hypothetical protein